MTQVRTVTVDVTEIDEPIPVITGPAADSNQEVYATSTA